jgi:hypothetical protein
LQYADEKKIRNEADKSEPGDIFMKTFSSHLHDPVFKNLLVATD